jgi:hypothetical protein
MKKDLDEPFLQPRNIQVTPEIFFYVFLELRVERSFHQKLLPQDTPGKELWVLEVPHFLLVQH